MGARRALLTGAAVLEASATRIAALEPGALVLDVGGWAAPLARADWVIDVMPYSSRGEPEGGGPERFRAETWVQRDICDRDPWPFSTGAFDFCVCSHTLEDVRDPVWVCSEIERVASAGYVEVPSLRMELSLQVHGPWVGWAHHRWLCDVTPDGIEVAVKAHSVHGRPDLQLPPPSGLSPAEQVQTLWWEGELPCREHVLIGDGAFAAWARERVPDLPDEPPAPRRSLLRRLGGLRPR